MYEAIKTERDGRASETGELCVKTIFVFFLLTDTIASEASKHHQHKLAIFSAFSLLTDFSDWRIFTRNFHKFLATDHRWGIEPHHSTLFKTYNDEFPPKICRWIFLFFLGLLGGAAQEGKTKEATRRAEFFQAHRKTTQNRIPETFAEIFSFKLLNFPRFSIFAMMKKWKKGGKRKKVSRDRKEIFCCFILSRLNWASGSVTLRCMGVCRRNRVATFAHLKFMRCDKAGNYFKEFIFWGAFAQCNLVMNGCINCQSVQMHFRCTFITEIIKH